MSNWSGLDFFIFLILLLNTLLGMARGATKEIISMLCLCAALVFTIKFTIPLTTFINSSPLLTDVISSPFIQNFCKAIGMPPLTESMLLQIGYSISLLICFSFAFCILEAVLAYSGSTAFFSFPYATIDRKLGASLGAVRGFVLTLILIIIAEHLYAGLLTGSYFTNLFKGSAKRFDQLIAQQAPERYKEILQGKDLYDSTKIIQELENPT